MKKICFLIFSYLLFTTLQKSYAQAGTGNHYNPHNIISGNFNYPFLNKGKTENYRVAYVIEGYPYNQNIELDFETFGNIGLHGKIVGATGKAVLLWQFEKETKVWKQKIATTKLVAGNYTLQVFKGPQLLATIPFIKKNA